MKKILLLMLFISLTINCFAEEYLELLVSTSDNVPSKKPRGQWDKKLLDEERAGNTKQGYIVAVNPEGFEWGRLEQDPKRCAIVKIPKSKWNPEWLEPEYDYDKPIYSGPDEIMAYEVKTMREYKLPLEKFLSGPEIAALRRIPYNDKEERPAIRKTVEDIEERVVVNNYEKRPPDWVSHGSSGTFTICSSGCDYTAASTWESTENADLTGTGPCIGKITGTWASSDGTGFSINGWTTTASDYIRLYTERSARHDGKWNTSAWRIEATAIYNIAIYEEFTRLDGLQFKDSATSGGPQILSVLVNNATSDIRITNCILWGNWQTGIAASRDISGGANYAAVVKAYNNICYNNYISDIAQDGIMLAGTTTMYNNTVVTCTNGYRKNGSTYTLKAVNCIAADVRSGGNGGFDPFTTWTSSDYNATSDTNGTGGANDRESQTFTFVNSTSDFHLQPTDTGAWNYGTPLYDDFPDDIDGEMRTGNWDIGADEIAEDPMQLGTHF